MKEWISMVAAAQRLGTDISGIEQLIKEKKLESKSEFGITYVDKASLYAYSGLPQTARYESPHKRSRGRKPATIAKAAVLDYLRMTPSQLRKEITTGALKPHKGEDGETYFLKKEIKAYALAHSVTRSEAAKMLHLTLKTVTNYCNAGKLHYMAEERVTRQSIEAMLRKSEKREEETETPATPAEETAAEEKEASRPPTPLEVAETVMKAKEKKKETEGAAAEEPQTEEIIEEDGDMVGIGVEGALGEIDDHGTRALVKMAAAYGYRKGRLDLYEELESFTRRSR